MSRRQSDTALEVKTPVDVLLAEHALHRRMLAVFERIVRVVEGGAAFPSNDVASVLGYLREFVELVHQRRESRTIYPLVMELADDRIAEEVGQLLADHDQTQELLQSLWLFWEPGPLRSDEVAVFVRFAKAYIERLRRHMVVEELSLFPAVLVVDDQRRAEIAAELERKEPGLTDLASWSSVVAELEERWIA